MQDLSNPQKNPEDFVNEVLSMDCENLERQLKQANAVKSMGSDLQHKISHKNRLLKSQMSGLLQDAKDGGTVGKSLVLLQEKTSLIDPNRCDFSMGTVRRMLAKLPFVGTPLSRWVARYQSVDAAIQDIMGSLEAGKERLERDNVSLEDEQVSLHELSEQLRTYIEFGTALDEKFTAASRDSALDDSKRGIIEENILFPLRQRLLDLQQQLAVTQQAIITIAVITRNNDELIRCVGRSLHVTISALNTAATLAIALHTQKRVLDGVEAVNKTTDRLISETSRRLKTQGAAIQRQATSAQLDIKGLKSAFRDIQIAMDDLQTFRRKALPEMSQSIAQMETLTRDMQGYIEQQDLEREPI